MNSNNQKPGNEINQMPGSRLSPVWFYLALVSLSLSFVFIFLNLCWQPNHDVKKSDDYFDRDSLEVQTGGVKMIPVLTPTWTAHVWTKRIGSNPKIKVLLLAGGPGIPHDYLEAFESFFPRAGIEFYYYDELGFGNSDKSEDTSRYNIGRAVEEVEQVRLELHLDKDNFYLLGHSWGGLLAMEYALKYQNHIKGLIVSDMCSSGAEFNRYVQNVLAPQMPPKVLDTLNELEAKRDYENPKYTSLVVDNFYTRFICRLPFSKWPEPLNRAFSKLNQPYYRVMQGPSEFGFLGRLRSWDIRSRLKGINVPTLMIGAKYDEMDPANIKWMSKQVTKGSYLFCATGSHLSMYDDQRYYMNGVISFINRVNQQE